jgi:uncharacterized protein (TIGR01777 family)
MKIIIPGGSGQVGTILARSFQKDGHEVVVLSRASSPQSWRVVPWDGQTLGPWVNEIEGADAVINLAGRSVNCRYTPANRKAILESRVNSTRVVGQAIAQAKRSPSVWLQMSTATLYSHRFDAPNDEASGILGGSEPVAPDTWRFSIDVAQAWEQTAREAFTPKTRKVLLRSAVVMSPDRGGIFDVLLRLVRFGLGGTAGDGRQYLSWIHHADFVDVIRFLIQHDEFAGPVNVCAPQPMTNSEFMRVLRDAWGARIGLPATEWMIEIGAFFIRTESELVLKSRRVIPGRLTDLGFKFQIKDWRTAASDLCQHWRDSVPERPGNSMSEACRLPE